MNTSLSNPGSAENNVSSETDFDIISYIASSPSLSTPLEKLLSEKDLEKLDHIFSPETLSKASQSPLGMIAEEGKRKMLV